MEIVNVFLIVIVACLIIYSKHLRNAIKDNERTMGRWYAENQEIRRLMRSLASKSGYELENCSNWVKKERK